MKDIEAIEVMQAIEAVTTIKVIQSIEATEAIIEAERLTKPAVAETTDMTIKKCHKFHQKYFVLQFKNRDSLKIKTTF